MKNPTEIDLKELVYGPKPILEKPPKFWEAKAPQVCPAQTSCAGCFGGLSEIFRCICPGKFLSSFP